MSLTSPLFTDLYQLTMAKAYLDSGKASQRAVFELFFRSCPFAGEYAIASGHNEVKSLLENFYFQEEDIRFLKSLKNFEKAPESFFDKLKALDLKDIKVRGLLEGELAFPRIPLLQLEGPLYKLQLLESPLLNAVNFSTLCATYARRIQRVARGKALVEFGMRRAQGPNGAMTASRASYVGGFDGTSNVLAGKEYGIPSIGTMAHAFVQSFNGLSRDELVWQGENVSKEIKEICDDDPFDTNPGELASFFSYAKSFPSSALFLVDTYNTLKSGVPNAIRLFKFLKRRNLPTVGIRLDSGDLVHLSQEARRMMNQAGFQEAQVFASNELSEEVIHSLEEQDAKIDGYGVGTHLVTCKTEPALGGVFKLVELDGQARLKLSEQTEKTVIPSCKNAYRFFGRENKALLDLLTDRKEDSPLEESVITAHHPFDRFKYTEVKPVKVEPLLHNLFENAQWLHHENLHDIRLRSLERMDCLRPDFTRHLNPTPYKVSLSDHLTEKFDKLFAEESRYGKAKLQ